MSFGGEAQHRRFSNHMPFATNDDDDVVDKVRRVAKERDQIYAEFTRLAEELSEAKRLHEVDIERADRLETENRQLRDSNSFFRDQYVMAMTEISGLVATINGMLAPAGQQVLSAFKNFHAAIDARTRKLEGMARDHIAGTREFAAQQRQKRADEALAQEQHDRIAEPMKDAIAEKRADSFDAINEDMANLVSKTRAPLGEPHKTVNEVIEQRAARLNDLEEGRQPPPDPEDTGTMMQRIRRTIIGENH